jgi:hypothetical protein
MFGIQAGKRQLIQNFINQALPFEYMRCFIMDFFTREVVYEI